MRDKDLLRLLLQNGWKELHVRGSHHKLRKGTHSEIIPVHGKDIPADLLNSILKRTGLK
ncbi:type II toxin-antitoxin system HicA family toxin [Selenomonas sputigena]|uniref:type II toxin-antitoxin system HicA family toxin n=1 Tax=Selenomonas sputigena TaxID=69823 RepID=UPI0028E600BB|nr:type II toxin-antitoxin system HicA family toxin [Selenomonas sputigena]